MFEGSGIGEFANHLGRCRNRCQPPHAHVDTHNRIGLGNVGPLRAGDSHPDSRDNSLSLARDCDPEDLGSFQGDEPFDASSVLVGTDGPQHRQGEVTTVCFETHGACREGESISVEATFLEPRNANGRPLIFPEHDICQRQ
jgi:hypothetical protein